MRPWNASRWQCCNLEYLRLSDSIFTILCCFASDLPAIYCESHLMRHLLALAILASMAAPVTASAQQYKAVYNGETVVLEDARNQITVSILPGVGNVAFSMKVKGQEIL